MENQLKRKREQSSSGKQRKSKAKAISTTTVVVPTAELPEPAKQSSGAPPSLAQPILEFCPPEQDCVEDCEEDSEEQGDRSPYFRALTSALNISPMNGVSVLTVDSFGGL